MGYGLLVVQPPVADPYLWGVHAVRAALLSVGGALLWWVSWRHWPMRVFAVGDERRLLRRRLRAVATTMWVHVGLVLLLGLVVLAQR